MADALRGSLDAPEYKHVLGPISLTNISDTFEEQHAKLEAEGVNGADPEDPDEYRTLSIFWVSAVARWHHLPRVRLGRPLAIMEALAAQPHGMPLNHYRR